MKSEKTRCPSAVAIPPCIGLLPCTEGISVGIHKSESVSSSTIICNSLSCSIVSLESAHTKLNRLSARVIVIAPTFRVSLGDLI